MKDKPFWKKRAWWGWVLATVSGCATLYTTDPTPLGVIKVVAALGAALGSYSVQESVRAIAETEVKK
jgi:hypothetical protein